MGMGMGMVLEPVTDLELLDHGGHAHLVLLGEAVQVAEHALVHGCRRRRRRPRKRGELGFGASGRKGRDGKTQSSNVERSEANMSHGPPRPTARGLGWAQETVQRAKTFNSFHTWAKILVVRALLPLFGE